MIKLDPIKIGDSIIWKMKLKNADNTAVNLTGFLIDIDAYNRMEIIKSPSGISYLYVNKNSSTELLRVPIWF